MTNEFQSLTDSMVVDLYKKAIIACRNSPRIMPYNDREYLIRRKVALRGELERRKLVLI